MVGTLLQASMKVVESAAWSNTQGWGVKIGRGYTLRRSRLESQRYRTSPPILPACRNQLQAACYGPVLAPAFGPSAGAVAHGDFVM
jgi:hypothetical protein